MDDAIREIDQIRSSMDQTSDLFDSTLPGRGNILKGQSLKEFREMNLELMRRVLESSQAPTIRGPRVDGFSLFFGMKTARMPYPAKGIDVVSWRRHFTQPGRFIGGGGASFVQNFAAFGNNVFAVLTLTDLPVTHWVAGFP